jgi:hypothetical protein
VAGLEPTDAATEGRWWQKVNQSVYFGLAKLNESVQLSEPVGSE